MKKPLSSLPSTIQQNLSYIFILLACTATGILTFHTLNARQIHFSKAIGTFPQEQNINEVSTNDEAPASVFATAPHSRVGSSGDNAVASAARTAADAADSGIAAYKSMETIDERFYLQDGTEAGY